jgi:hypothetical protein
MRVAPEATQSGSDTSVIFRSAATVWIANVKMLSTVKTSIAPAIEDIFLPIPNSPPTRQSQHYREATEALERKRREGRSSLYPD